MKRWFATFAARSTPVGSGMRSAYAQTPTLGEKQSARSRIGITVLACALVVFAVAAFHNDANTSHNSTRTLLSRGRLAASAWIAAGARDTAHDASTLSSATVRATSTPATPRAASTLVTPRPASTPHEATRVTPQTAIALGYLERLRLGLGSPYRLIDYAMHDPRLADTTRTTLAWAILARTLDGAAYQIDAAALDRGGARGIQSWPGVGEKHLALISDAISDARDPRGGELAVRVGYALAATEGSLPAQAPRYAANVAALVRDRVLAMRDARAIVRTADAQHIDAMTLLQHWRAERKLSVEAPPLATMPQDDERDALTRANRIAAELRDLGDDAQKMVQHHPDTVAVQPSLLTHNVARLLLAQADSLNMPPLAPLVVGALSYDHELVAQPWLTPDERATRRGLENAGSEERFAARLALVERRGAFDVVPSLVAVWSAVGMRALSQETVWFPGYAAPSAHDLTQRYGLADVSFAPSVPVAWRPYYRRMIDVALSDMRLVLPSLNVRGLSIRFQELGRDAGTLALHDPAHRRLLLPPSTAAGTLAHEITHDVDWQVALQRYHTRGDYASDRAVRAGTAHGDGLALRMQDLSVGNNAARMSPTLAAHEKRPTEILARNVDFFVAATLAEHGRIDGYLSSVQDELLTGYGTVRAPELTGVAADALISILDQIAPVRSDTRNWFLRNYGSGRTLRSYDLVRGVLEANIGETRDSVAGARAPDPGVFEKIAHARDNGDHAIDAWTCRMPAGAYSAPLEQARRALITEAAQARARGYAIRRARALMGRPAAHWVTGQLFGGPWHVEGVTPAMENYLKALVDGARDVSTDAPIFSNADPFTIAGSAVSTCAS